MFITVTYVITACYIVKYIFSNKCREGYNSAYLYFIKQTVLKLKIMPTTENNIGQLVVISTALVLMLSGFITFIIFNW